jgi:hypothetical protein
MRHIQITTFTLKLNATILDPASRVSESSANLPPGQGGYPQGDVANPATNRDSTQNDSSMLFIKQRIGEYLCLLHVDSFYWALPLD